MLELLFASLTVMIASLVGVFSLWQQLGKALERKLDLLISFSAGVFLVVAYELAHEAIEHAANPETAIFWIFFGAIGIVLFFKLIPHFHHHHGKEEEDTHSYIDSRRIIFGDALHNIGDGIVLASSFTVSKTLGVVTLLSVFVHELVQETSEFFVLRQAGYSTNRALLINFAVSATILIGALGSYFLLDTFELIEAPLLGVAAGSFLVVVFQDLIPHSARTIRDKGHVIKHLVWFALGLGLMTALDLLLGGH